MAFKCAICGSEQNVNVVCHHCGRPLCEKHRQLRVNDKAFVDRWYQAPLRALRNALRRLFRQEVAVLTAYHCSTCSDQHHAWPWQ